jgi:hypothetical protein
VNKDCVVRGSNPVGEVKFSINFWTCTGTYPELCIMSVGSFQGLKRAGRGDDHPPTSSAEVKETDDLCLYCFRVNFTFISFYYSGFLLYPIYHFVLLYSYFISCQVHFHPISVFLTYLLSFFLSFLFCHFHFKKMCT